MNGSSSNTNNGENSSGESNQNDGETLNGSSNNTNNGENSDGDSNRNNEDNDDPIPSSDDENEEPIMAIALKDVCDSMTKFGGLPFENLDEWEAEFQESADTYKWSDAQKMLYAKKLFTGAASTCAKAKKGLRSYKDLAEWPNTTTTLDIQTKMMSEKKKSKESYLEYFYRMRGIGEAKLDAPSMLKLIFDGLSEDMQGKLHLYEAKTYTQLKEKLLIKDLTSSPKEEGAMVSALATPLLCACVNDMRMCRCDCCRCCSQRCFIKH